MGVMEVIAIIGNAFSVIGIVLMIIGTLGVFLMKDFYPRILVASKVDTVGLLTFLIGVCLQHGFSFFSAKVLLIIIIVLVLNPLVTHILTRSAYQSGYDLAGTLEEEESTLKEEEQSPKLKKASKTQ